MKKLSKNRKLLGFITILIVTIIIAVIITTSVIKNNNQVASDGYSATTANEGSSLISNYILNGITIGGITGKMEVLDTSDATATPEDILWGKTGYVKGKKITGTRIETVAQGKEAKCTFEKDITLIDDLENQVRIPEGFKIAEDSATVVEDGIVIEDLVGNQFVWIPAKTGTGATINLSTGGTATIVYQRTDFRKQHGSYSDYSETMPSDEEASVNAWGGYYIGRYEAGDKESTEAKTMRSGQTDATITIKKGQAPYNYITQANAKTKAEGMDEAQQYATATTKLVSSYAWDTAIDFIQKAKSAQSTYGKSSPQGNYYDRGFDYANLGETEKNSYKNENSSTLVPTGQTTAVSNIYDMGGNLYEYTTESYSYEGNPCVSRGGYYGNSYDRNPAGYRGSDIGNARSNFGFRVTLYCSTES